MSGKIPLVDIEINENIYNLYTILLQYLDKLLKSNHPKINLITEVMDELISLRTEDIQKDELKIKFNAIHSKAYNNLSTIYDYDKEQQEEEKRREEQQKELEIQAVSD